jgi:hypothetical protein
VPRLKVCGSRVGTASKRGNVGFTGADAYGLVDREGEDLAVANISRPRGPPDAFNDVFRVIVRDYDLDFNLRHEAHGMLEAAGCTRAAVLPAVSLTSVRVNPCTPVEIKASRTASSLKGLMIAITSFIRLILLLVGVRTGIAGMARLRHCSRSNFRGTASQEPTCRPLKQDGSSVSIY